MVAFALCSAAPVDESVPLGGMLDECTRYARLVAKVCSKGRRLNVW